MTEMYDNPKHVEDTFTQDNLSEYLLQAQWAEFVELKKEISKLYTQKKKPISLLDIGIGDARIAKHLSGIEDIWKMIKSYDGIDNAQNCINISNKTTNDLHIQDKVSVRLLDAVNLNKLNKKYDLIFSTWFTVGNFYPFDYKPETFVPGQDMSKNDKLTHIFRQAYKMLNPGGEIVIGSMYKDNEPTRLKQEAAYRHFGWTIITDARDCFTATKDGWWSQRYTKKRIYDYLDFIPKNKISFVDLDTYNFAMMVKIKK
jgi:hypothetical protein